MHLHPFAPSAACKQGAAVISPRAEWAQFCAAAGLCGVKPAATLQGPRLWRCLCDRLGISKVVHDTHNCIHWHTSEEKYITFRQYNQLVPSLSSNSIGVSPTNMLANDLLVLRFSVISHILSLEKSKGVTRVRPARVKACNCFFPYFSKIFNTAGQTSGSLSAFSRFTGSSAERMSRVSGQMITCFQD